MFALFDSEVTSDAKAPAMATEQQNTPHLINLTPGKPVFPWLVFDLLQANDDWLDLPPEQWQGNQNYMSIFAVINNQN